MVLRKKEVYTVVTPIPGFIPRQLGIDILHSHSEVITLNPLVLGHKPIKAPRDAASDEYYSTWYEITERIQYIPGIGKIGSGKISFNGCFHDLPWGLQTHTYAPANVDIRIKYRIGGNQPGVEPPEQQEIGLAALGAPKDGLYLREDIEIRCNFAMVGFVKTQLKAASKEMVDRIIKKAELLDSGVLQAMIEDGKLKTINPNDRSQLNLGATSPPHSPGALYRQSIQSQPQPPLSPQMPYHVPRPMSLQQPPGQHLQYNRPGTAGSQQGGYPYYQNQNPYQKPYQQRPHAAELPPSDGPPATVMELPGDTYYHHPQISPSLQPSQPSPQHPDNASRHSSQSSPDPNAWRWSQSQIGQQSHHTSYSSDGGSAGYMSPAPDNKGYTSELPTHQETREEDHQDALKKLDPRARTRSYNYNPADYAKVGH